ncbi:hypothetical protein QKW35_01500 [Pontibacterium granulatum]|uniref:hypothetical protein n=1 Tax=Pontibacterium granulatum TaxID=2036029 RepID=UPI00249BD58B|nr:hypothetical protein [Pontibacterium granulatum]MDI3323038.1 hypothetical protein [Pontibacterium granulatum]
MTLATHGAKKEARKSQVLGMVKAFFSFLSLILFPTPVYAAILTDYKYQTYFAGAYWFRDASVVKRTLEQKGLSSAVLTQNPPGTRGRIGGSHTIYFLIALASLLSRVLRRLDRSGKLEDYVDGIFASREVADLVQSGQVTRERLIRNIYFVIVARFLFVILLRRLQAKKCFIVCYYSCLGMALCAACRSLSIEAVDMQHGVSGSAMRAYGRWSSFPVGGQLNTLPDTFYCWTEMDRKSITEWGAMTDGQHRALLTGNLWRDFLAQAELDGGMTESIEDSQLAKLCSQYARVIVFCAQRNPMPELIREAIIRAPADWLFLIRLHPDTEHSQLSAVQSLYKAIGSNVEVVDATKASIRSVMKLADIHLTEWSGAVYDAFFEGVDSIVLTAYGEDYFSDFVDQGVVTRMSTPDKLVACIAEKLGSPSVSSNFRDLGAKESILELMTS